MGIPKLVHLHPLSLTFSLSLSLTTMAGIKVHGALLSTATQRVFAALYEKELDFELVPVNMSVGAHKQEPFIKLNPFGQVPAFEDGDLKLFESRAITQYIAHTYHDKGTQLIYQDPRMSHLSVWMEVEAHQYDPVASKLAFEIVFKPMIGMTTDPAAVEENEAKLVKVLDIYETRLTHSKYIGGDSFTLADVHHLPVTHILLGTHCKKLFDARPAVSAWLAEIMARPAWLKVLEKTSSHV